MLVKELIVIKEIVMIRERIAIRMIIKIRKLKPVIRQHLKIGQTIRKYLIYRQRGDALWIGLMQ